MTGVLEDPCPPGLDPVCHYPDVAGSCRAGKLDGEKLSQAAIEMVRCWDKRNAPDAGGSGGYWIVPDR